MKKLTKKCIDLAAFWQKATKKERFRMSRMSGCVDAWMRERFDGLTVRRLDGKLVDSIWYIAGCGREGTKVKEHKGKRA